MPQRTKQHLRRVSLRDTLHYVIKSFRHDGLERFFLTGSRAGIQPAHARRLSLQLGALSAATNAADMNLPGWRWQPLKADFAEHGVVMVNGDWRLTFAFAGSDAIWVDYGDYP
jgi:proteic killer suppression protein